LVRDPLGFVWQYALGWHSPEYSKQPLDLDPLAFGELIHEMLRRTVSVLEPTPGFARATSDEIEAALSASMKLISQTWPLERPVPPALLWEHTLLEAARRSLRGLTVDEPLQASTRTWTELAFGHSGTPDETDAPWQVASEVGIGETGLRFGGRMDRVDIRSDRSGVRISDYKSGAAPKNADRIVLSQGRELQRVLYSLAVRQLVPNSTIVARLVYLKDESSPISLRGGALDAAIGETIAFVEIARRLVEAGSAIPGPDAKDEYNDMRLAHPADLDGYFQNKQAAFATRSRVLSRLWSRP
jgi:ATP-dependent helicase/DNAse subunit B